MPAGQYLIFYALFLTFDASLLKMLFTHDWFDKFMYFTTQAFCSRTTTEVRLKIYHEIATGLLYTLYIYGIQLKTKFYNKIKKRDLNPLLLGIVIINN